MCKSELDLYYNLHRYNLIYVHISFSSIMDMGFTATSNTFVCRYCCTEFILDYHDIRWKSDLSVQVLTIDIIDET